MKEYINQLIKRLYGNTQEGVFIIWARKENKPNPIIRTHPHDISDINGMNDRIAKLIAEQFDVFFGVCLQKECPPSGKRGKAETVSVMPGLWFDLDVNKPNCPATQDEALSFVNGLTIKPTMVISSGYGYHVYYLFEKPWVFKKDDEYKQGDTLNKRFRLYINSHGWKFDPTSDIARVLRVPDTLNFKKDTPAEVKVVQYDNNNRYTPQELTAFLEDQNIAEEKDLTSQVKPMAPEISPDRDNYPTAYIENIERECAWIMDCKENGANQSYNEWFAMLSIVGKCKDGRAIAHKWSELHPKYTPEETDRKLKETEKAGPWKCKTIRFDINGEKYCNECIHWGKIKSPINLGNKEPDISRQFNFTDRGNAKRLVYLYGKNLRYARHLGRWLIWNKRIWKPDYKNDEIYRTAEETIDSMCIGLDENSDHIRKHAKISESLAKIKNMIFLARKQRGISASSDELDRDNWLIACRNGTVDLKIGQLRSSRRSDLMTKMVPVAYKPDATCPMFEKFLLEIMDGRQELANFLQRAVGYSLTGNVDEHAIFFLHGGGGNGKSTFLEIIRSMLGDYAMQANFDTFLKQFGSKVSNDIARLKGSRFVSAIEAERGKQFNESIINKMSGGDKLTARFLYGEEFEFTPTFKLFLAASHKPPVKADDDGFWRRLKIIPFDVKFDDNSKDKGLKQRIIRKELPGVFNWALKGCLQWQQDGLMIPDVVKQASLEYREDEDVIKQYLDERVQSEGQITKAELYNDYVAWCNKNGEKDKGMRSFGAELKKKGFVEGRSSKERYWKDISLREKLTVST